MSIGDSGIMWPRTLYIQTLIFNISDQVLYYFFNIKNNFDEFYDVGNDEPDE